MKCLTLETRTCTFSFISHCFEFVPTIGPQSYGRHHKKRKILIHDEKKNKNKIVWALVCLKKKVTGHIVVHFFCVCFFAISIFVSCLSLTYVCVFKVSVKFLWKHRSVSVPLIFFLFIFNFIENSFTSLWVNPPKSPIWLCRIYQSHTFFVSLSVVSTHHPIQ